MTRLNTKQILAANMRRLMDTSASLNTQVKLAARAGIAQSTVGRLLRGEVYAQLAQVEAIADAFHITVGELLTDHSLTSESAPTYDKIAFAKLPATEKAQISAFIDFVIQRQDESKMSDPLSLSKKTDLPPDLKDRLMEAIQRELNDDTLTLGHESKTERRTKGRRKRSSS
ncbi:helix-turn-helix transcriptional regulator [Caballeronia sp. dw_19]|jgi:transcriptional regulator with XRE-family HTH domain|uniref:helix-turn-helix domain-containing protein n=1 Tax=Caballeronia sp. dw_19 TaxID=2719791 RepID=UPI001BD550CC|nr:helix-turn-helix transcriptional regulator [Caballeronia sp. dw_19]